MNLITKTININFSFEFCLLSGQHIIKYFVVQGRRIILVRFPIIIKRIKLYEIFCLKNELNGIGNPQKSIGMHNGESKKKGFHIFNGIFSNVKPI